MKKAKFLLTLSLPLLVGSLLASCGNKPVESSVVPSSEVTSSSESSSSESIVKKYKVTFDLNGGTLPDGYTIEDQEVEEGHWAVKPLVSPTKAHSTFLGWYTSDGFQFNFMTQIYGDVALIATYQVNEESKVTLTFDPNNGEPTYTVETFIGDSITTRTHSKEGFAFNGWYYGDNQRFTGYVSDEVANARTLTAQYVKQDFNFYFSINDDGSLTIEGIRDVNSVVVTFPSEIEGRPVTKIGQKALQSRIYVETVTIPASVKEIDPAFADGARKLTTFYVEAGNMNYQAVDGVLYTRDMKTLVRAPAKGLQDVNFTVPSSVTKIGDHAFMDQKDEGMNGITFNEGLVEIGDRAFSQWQGFTSLSFPSTLRKIDGYAFYTSDSSEKLTITWGNGIEEIGEAAFFGEYIANELVLPEGLKKIGAHAFATFDGGNAITDVVLPSTLEEFAPGVFTNCYGIKTVKLASGNSHYVVSDNILYTADKKTAVWVPSDHGGNISFEEGCETIGSYACGEIRYFDSLSFPSTVTEFADYAFFYNATLTSITVPDTVTRLGISCFDRCGKLSSVDLGSGVEFIGKYALAEIAISSITLPESLKTIDQCGFWGTGIKSINFSEGLETIGDSAFYFTDSSAYEDDYYGTPATGKLTELVLPDSLVTLGNYAFSQQTALKSVTFGKSLTNVGAQPFYGANLTSMKVKDGSPLAVKDLCLYSNAEYERLIYASAAKNGDFVIPESCKEIGDAACAAMKVDSVTLPSTLEKIGKDAFYSAFGYSANVSIEIPAKVKSIGEDAFRSSNLAGLTFAEGSTLEEIGDGAFGLIKTTGNLALPNTVKRIGEYAFYAADVRAFSMPSSIESIGEYAFFGNKSMTGDIVIPATLKSCGEAILGTWGNVGTGNEISSITVDPASTDFSSQDNILFDKDKTKAYAIAGQTPAQKITLPETLKTIGAFGLADASFVTGFVLPEGLLEIGDYGLSGCTSITVLNIPSTVITMGERVFNSWSVAQTVKIPHTKDWCNIHWQQYWNSNSNASFVYNA